MTVLPGSERGARVTRQRYRPVLGGRARAGRACRDDGFWWPRRQGRAAVGVAFEVRGHPGEQRPDRGGGHRGEHVPVKLDAERAERRTVRPGKREPRAASWRFGELDIGVKRGKQAAGHAGRLPAQPDRHHPWPAERLGEPDPDEPGDTWHGRQRADRPDPQQVLHAALVDRRQGARPVPVRRSGSANLTRTSRETPGTVVSAPTGPTRSRYSTPPS